MARLRAGHTILMADVTPAELGQLTPDQEHRELIHRFGVVSAMLVPLRGPGRTIGTLTLGRVAGGAPYGGSDLALAEELAARVAAKVDNARSFARERATAEMLARTLMPGRLPRIPGVEVAAGYRAAGDVGGDFYDCFPMGGGTWLLVVGDVCGRGIRPASMTGRTRHTIRAAALHSSSPATILGDLNRLLLDAADEDMAASGDRRRRGRSRVSAPCAWPPSPPPPPAPGSSSVPPDIPCPSSCGPTAEVGEVGAPGTLLGVVEDFEVHDEPFDLGPGDALVLFTDGITERRREGRLFEEDLVATLEAAAGASAAGMARRVEQAAVAFAPVEPDDDMAVLVLSVPRRKESAST